MRPSRSTSKPALHRSGRSQKTRGSGIPVRRPYNACLCVDQQAGTPLANIDNPAAEMAADGFFSGSRWAWNTKARVIAAGSVRPPAWPRCRKPSKKALSKVADSPVSLHCAGRTDAGVHACGQVVHFDTQVERSMKAWVMGANINLPHDVSVSWAKVMPADFSCAVQGHRPSLSLRDLQRSDPPGAPER